MSNTQQTTERLTANLRLSRNKNPKRVSEKMRNLVVCQANFMQVLLQKIDRRSKPIKKHEATVSANLKRKRILLENENFDLVGVLKQAAKGLDKRSPVGSQMARQQFGYKPVLHNELSFEAPKAKKASPQKVRISSFHRF